MRSSKQDSNERLLSLVGLQKYRERVMVSPKEAFPHVFAMCQARI